MAETIGFAIVSALATATGTAITVSATTASVIGSLAITTASVGANLLISSLNQPKPRNETQQSVLNQAIGPRVGVYGRTIVGGSRFLFETRNGALMQGIVLAAHGIDAIEKYLIGDRYAQVVQISTDGDGRWQVTDFPQINVVSYENHLGADGQAASPYLLGQFPGIWTSEHRLRGLAYVAVQFLGVKREEQQLVYPQSYATPLRFLIRGKKVWDPTNPAHNPDDKSTFGFSEIAADCILDYLLSADGARFRRSKIDIASFQDAHNLHAETVARKDGSTEFRYRLSGTYRFDEAPKDVLTRMLATCDGRLVRGPTGLIGLRGGRYIAPTVTIATRSIVRASLAQGNDRLDTYNRLKVSYSDPDAYYQPTELQARQDTASQAQIGVVDEAIDLAMVPSWTQAARLAKIKYARDHPAWKGTLATDLSALNAMGEDTVRITYDPLGEVDPGPMMDTVAELPAFGLRADMSGCDLSFSAIDSAAYAWNPATEEPPRPALPTYVPPINDVPIPSGVNVSQSLRSGQAYAVLAWNASPRPDTTPQPQYRNNTGDDGDYVGMTIRSDGQSAEAGPLTNGQTYRFRVRFVAGGTPSAWSNAVTLLIDTTP
ncbi:hypothetical protein HNR00_003593 [Methylorubrum rhodinum]|uniref:Tip attachment protein J domain-containing protein n=1 Tax=Methylorubrum rhodinum TaxID=29428 RepID=A0A840ZMP4_9HYPH|nr:phage tail protein [Methylorubrum rhodinum]MBB5758866.1 hypothetical protein [Methylorubrum rhodinum]